MVKVVYKTGDHFDVCEYNGQYVVGNRTFELTEQGFKDACNKADELNGKVTENIENNRLKYRYND